MKRKYVAGTAVAAAWFFGGPINSTSEKEPVPILPKKSAAAFITKINVAVLPDEVPAAVTHQEPNVIKINKTKKTFVGDNRIYRTLTAGSGVRVAKSKYITARHVLEDDNTNSKNGSNSCDEIYVSTPISRRAVRAGHPSGTGLPVQGLANRFISNNSSTTLDVGLLFAPDQDNVTPTNRSIITKSELNIGETVFSINYQPTSSMNQRDPNNSNLSSSEASRGLNKPAIYGGVVIKKMPDGLVLVAEKLRGYGSIQDTFTRKGASGGGVWSKKTGEFKGITIGSRNYPLLPRVTDVERKEEIDLVGVRDNEKIGISVIQPITQNMIDELSNQVNSADLCK